MILDLKALVTTYNLSLKGVIHVGAHYGQEYNTYKELNINKMMFFEPTPETFAILKDNIKQDPDVTLYNIALGNKKSKELMFVEKNNSGQSNSLLEPNIHTLQYPHIVFKEKIEIEVDLLDNISFNREEYNFMNLDVQGYELEVLKGSSQTLQSVDYIMTEINRAYVYKDCALEQDLDAFLSVYNFKRVETDWMGGTWGDAFYIKS